MTKQEIYDAIKAWEADNGESMLDGRFFPNELTFMTWCLGKGYLSSEKYDLWVSAFKDDDLEATDSNYYVYAPKDMFGDDVPFAVVITEEWTEEGQDKAFMILAEFISEISEYQKRFNDFLNEEE